MNPESYALCERHRLGSRLAGVYLRTLLWYFLGVTILWLAGFESIYGHPTPFYALYLPAFASPFVPAAVGLAMGLAYWVVSRHWVQRTVLRQAVWGGACVAVVLVAAVALYEDVIGHGDSLVACASRQGSQVIWHLLALTVFLLGLTFLLAWLRKSCWFDANTPDLALREERRMLLALFLFALAFPCVVAMIRNGPEGIAQAYRREAYEYIGDIGIGGTIRGLFGKYDAVQSYLSLHARAAPPGPIALLWGLSYLVGRSPMALALATVFVGGLAVFPLYAWARDLVGQRVALASVLLYVLIPSIVLFTATSAEILFMPFTLGTLFLFDRAIDRGRPGYALAAGIGFGLMSLLKFTLLGFGIYFILVGLWKLRPPATRRNVFQTAFLMGGMFVLFHAGVWFWSGFDVFHCFFEAKVHFDMDQAKLDLITPRFPGWTYRFINPFTFFYFAGIPVSLLFLWRILKPDGETRTRFLFLAATFFALNLMYLGRGEGERSALYLFPLLAVPAAHALDALGRKSESVTPLAATLAFLAFQCWLTESYFYTYW